LSKALLGRSEVPPRFLGIAAWIIGARATVRGDAVGAHSLLVANHTSWLDILVLAGTTRCAFVSKDNLGSGFIHWLADQNHTLYISRSDRRAARDQALALASKLNREQPVALFPEGTTGPGDRLLPFRPTLLEAATLAPETVAIRPVAIDYGAAATDIGWHGEPGRDNVRRVLGRKGTFRVAVHLLPALKRVGDRKALTAAAYEAIAAKLAASSLAPRRL
jgi:1-acyl-sn-glycerol-3-phosphate acyltransferase